MKAYRVAFLLATSYIAAAASRAQFCVNGLAYLVMFLMFCPAARAQFVSGVQMVEVYATVTGPDGRGVEVPLAFVVDGLLSAATFNLLSVSYRLALSALVLLWASGLAMRAWHVQDGASGSAVLQARGVHGLSGGLSGTHLGAALPKTVWGINANIGLC